MKIIRKVISPFTVIALIVLVGCGSDTDKQIISDADVLNVKVYVSEEVSVEDEGYEGRDRPNNAIPVVALVTLGLNDSGTAFDDVKFIDNPSINPGDYRLWGDGDSIRIRITQSKSTGGTFAEYYFFHEHVIFLGFCFPGDYALVINEREIRFSVEIPSTDQDFKALGDLLRHAK